MSTDVTIIRYRYLRERKISQKFIHTVNSRGGVEDTKLEAKAKDTKKSEAKAKDSPSADRSSRG